MSVIITVLSLAPLTDWWTCFEDTISFQALEKKVRDSLARANEVAEEACSSMRTVRSFANEQEEGDCYVKKLGVTYKLRVKEAFAYAGFIWCSDVSQRRRSNGLVRSDGRIGMDAKNGLDRLCGVYLSWIRVKDW